LNKEKEQREAEYKILSDCISADSYDRYIKFKYERPVLRSLEVLEKIAGEEYFDVSSIEYNKAIIGNTNVTIDLLESIKLLNQSKPQVIQEMKQKVSLVKEAKDRIVVLNDELSKLKEEYNNALSENAKYTKLVVEEKKLVETLTSSLELKSNQTINEIIRSPLILRDILNLPKRIRSLTRVPCKIFSESQIEGNAREINKINFFVGLLIQPTVNTERVRYSRDEFFSTIEYTSSINQFCFYSSQQKDKEYIQIDFCYAPLIESLQILSNDPCMNEYSLHFSKNSKEWICAKIFVHKGGWAVYNINAEEPYRYWKLGIEKYSGKETWHSIQFFEHKELEFVA
jgi:hypothetical protein